MLNKPGKLSLIFHKFKKIKSPHDIFFFNIIISAALIIITIVVFALWFKFRPDNKTEKYDLFNIDIISELTTLECRYHNVSVYDYKGKSFGVGKKYVWFEYDVIVDVGVDIKQIKIEPPTKDGVIKIYLPPAKILGARHDKSTISKPVCELGPFTELTAEEELNIINDGVENLKKDEKTNEIIQQANNSAKEVLEKYFINIGDILGEKYSVEWIETEQD